MTLERALEIINSDIIHYEELIEARKMVTEALQKMMEEKKND